MSSSVTINGKEYIQSTLLANSCGYSSDYIAKLAREEKVIGTQVGRQWFVEPHSLDAFLQQARIEKEIRKQELSRQRKLEQSAFQKKRVETSPSDVLKKAPFSIAFAESVVVLVCGLFLGSIAWVAQTNNVGVSELSEAFMRSASFVAVSLSPVSGHRSFLASAPSTLNLAASSESMYRDQIDRQTSIPEVFATLPQFSGQSDVAASSTNGDTTESVQADLPFSDEVQISKDKNGNELVTPLFKRGASSSTQYVLVPVNQMRK